VGASFLCESKAMRTIEWSANGTVRMIDQRKLPLDLVVVECTDYREVARAIQDMTIRGAPAIGAAAAFGLALAARQSRAVTSDALRADLQAAAQAISATRPTAVNLFWAIDRMLARARAVHQIPVPAQVQALIAEAQAIADEDVEINRRMGAHGAVLIEDGFRILTHCNAGALATVDYGTVLAVVRTAHEQGKKVHVWVDETRPRLQGASLTAWELMRDGIPMTLIADNASGHLMRTGRVDIVLVGSDRTAANGDVANKIGTYKLAVLARENGIPFYPVVPTSTIDLNIPTGDDIPIEERDPREVTHIRGCQIAPDGVHVFNPAFDVTPHRYVTGIVTENGIAYPPYGPSLRRVVSPPLPHLSLSAAKGQGGGDS
jgi:methylthioribose-1-phosphate isomerase